MYRRTHFFALTLTLFLSAAAPAVKAEAATRVDFKASRRERCDSGVCMAP